MKNLLRFNALKCLPLGLITIRLQKSLNLHVKNHPILTKFAHPRLVFDQFLEFCEIHDRFENFERLLRRILSRFFAEHVAFCDFFFKNFVYFIRGKLVIAAFWGFYRETQTLTVLFQTIFEVCLRLKNLFDVGADFRAHQVLFVVEFEKVDECQGRGWLIKIIKLLDLSLNHRNNDFLDRNNSGPLGFLVGLT